MERKKNMTENLLQKLEEKMMMLLSEIEDLRKEVHRLTNENKTFSLDKDNHTRKLQDLISLLDAVSPPENMITNITKLTTKPLSIEVQDKVEG